MPDDPVATQQPEDDPPPRLEVIETDSGRRPIWGIVAGIGFLVLAVVAVLRVTAGDSNSTPSYSSSVSATTIVSAGGNATGKPDAKTPRQNSTAAAIFFFALVGTMVLVAMRIVWRARQIYRAAARHASKRPGATLS